MKLLRKSLSEVTADMGKSGFEIIKNCSDCDDLNLLLLEKL
jgi:hypothetical protein